MPWEVSGSCYSGVTANPSAVTPGASRDRPRHLASGRWATLTVPGEWETSRIGLLHSPEQNGWAEMPGQRLESDNSWARLGQRPGPQPRVPEEHSPGLGSRVVSVCSVSLQEGQEMEHVPMGLLRDGRGNIPKPHSGRGLGRETAWGEGTETSLVSGGRVGGLGRSLAGRALPWLPGQTGYGPGQHLPFVSLCCEGLGMPQPPPEEPDPQSRSGEPACLSLQESHRPTADFRLYVESRTRHLDELSRRHVRVCQLYSRTSTGHLQVLGKRVRANGEDGNPYGVGLGGPREGWPGRRW